MELFKTRDYYIFQHGEHSLWCSRKTGRLEPRTAWELTAAGDLVCCGMVHGIIGKLNPFPDCDALLLVIESCSLVGYVWNRQPIYKINKIGLLSLGPMELDITTHPCPKHSQSVAFNQKPEDAGSKPVSRQQEALAKTWGSIKSATKSLKTSTVQAAHRIGIDGGASGRDSTSGGERAVRKLLDEVEKMFCQSDSFYFSPGVDLTKSVQVSGEDYVRRPSWKTADERFFWNQFLLKELIDLKDPKADAWIIPILHGYVHIDTVGVELEGEPLDGGINRKSLTLVLLSRRSRYRAGTRYKRRGVDEAGHVANYVETEQCLLFEGHVASFVQIRGSVPVFWSQPGFKYRPPPQIDRGVEDTRQAFQRHFEKELSVYGKQCIVSLVEQGGKEKVVGDAFTEQILHLDEPRLTYVTFDFHEHCRGMRFENVARLLGGLEDILQDMRYTWIDSHGIIHRQQSTFRVNCMDCLDRTNVCQTAFAKYMLEVQLSKLGILPPEGSFWPALKSAFNIMWANNGDILSRQYAGTNALKGDFTRTGERRFAGMMKDGMNSANRYYLNRFKDSVKQTAIDVMLGNVQPEEAVNLLFGHQNNLMTEDENNDEEAVLQTADRVRQVIDDCRKQWVEEDDIVVGSWGLVDAHPLTGDPLQVDMDVIVLLSREYLYVVSYDDDQDQVRNCKKYPLATVTKLEVGSEGKSASRSNVAVNFLKSPKRESQSSTSASSFVMRIHLLDGGPLQFRSTRLRFFNNMAVPICKTEDMNESLKAIAENIHVTMEISGMSIPYVVGTLEKYCKTSTTKIGHIEVPLVWQGFPRNTSEGQLSAFKQVGNKALSSVTSQFSRLKPGSVSKSLARPTGKQEPQPSRNETDTRTTEPGDTTEHGSYHLQSNYSSAEDLSDLYPVKDVLFSTEAGILFLASRNPALLATAVQQQQPVENGGMMPSTSKALFRCVSAGQFDPRHLPKAGCNGQVVGRKRLNATPEILISFPDTTSGPTGVEEDRLTSSSLVRSKPLSHSTEFAEPTSNSSKEQGSYLSLSGGGESGGGNSSLPRAASETSLGSSQSGGSEVLKSSKSEHESGFHLASVLASSFKIPAPQGRFNILTPPGLKNSPLGLLAKGVQNLGQLDPRKMLDSSRRDSSGSEKTNKDIEEIRMQNLCSTRIIRL